MANLENDLKWTREQWSSFLSNPANYQVQMDVRGGGGGNIVVNGQTIGRYENGLLIAHDDMSDGSGGSQFTGVKIPATVDPSGKVTAVDASGLDFFGAKRENRGNDRAWQTTAMGGAAAIMGGGLLAAYGGGGAGAAAAGAEGAAAGGAAAGGEAAALAAAENGIAGSTVGASGGGAGAYGGAAAGGGGLLGSTAPAAAPAATTGGGLLSAAGTAANALNSPVGATLAGAALGAAGANKPTTSTSSTQLPEYLQPYAPMYAQRVNDLSNKPFEAYTGQGVAGLNADQLSAADMVRQQAGQVNPLNGAAQSQLMDTMSGRYLDPNSNPYLQSTFDQAAKRMTDAYDRSSATTNSAFNDAGSFGSSGHRSLVESNNRAFGDSLASLGNSIYGGNYQQERSRQATAGLQAPNVAGTMQSNAYRNAEALGASGASQQQNQQQQFDWNYGQFQRQQEYPYRQLDTMASMFNPNLGRTQTQTQPGISTTQGLLGGAAAGLGMYRQAGGLLGNSTSQSTSQPTNTGGGFAPQNGWDWRDQNNYSGF